MERLTVKRKDGRWAIANNDGASSMEQMKKLPSAINRLAAYEDTGLEPEEVMGLCSMSERAKMADLLRLEVYQSLGSIDYLRKLAQAEKDGRLIALPPIKIGDTTFFIINKRIYEGKVYFMRWEHHKSFGVRGDISADSFGGCVGASLFDFGKTVFLTREEAEAALKKREEADNETD